MCADCAWNGCLLTFDDNHIAHIQLKDAVVVQCWRGVAGNKAQAGGCLAVLGHHCILVHSIAGRIGCQIEREIGLVKG